MKKNNVDKILIATAFPIYGAGSGVLVNLQSAYHKLFNKEVHIVTANNRDDFPKQDDIKYSDNHWWYDRIFYKLINFKIKPQDKW